MCTCGNKFGRSELKCIFKQRDEQNESNELIKQADYTNKWNDRICKEGIWKKNNFQRMNEESDNRSKPESYILIQR